MQSRPYLLICRSHAPSVSDAGTVIRVGRWPLSREPQPCPQEKGETSSSTTVRLLARNQLMSSVHVQALGLETDPAGLEIFLGKHCWMHLVKYVRG